MSSSCRATRCDEVRRNPLVMLPAFSLRHERCGNSRRRNQSVGPRSAILCPPARENRVHFNDDAHSPGAGGHDIMRKLIARNLLTTPAHRRHRHRQRGIHLPPKSPTVPASTSPVTAAPISASLEGPFVSSARRRSLRNFWRYFRVLEESLLPPGNGGCYRSRPSAPRRSRRRHRPAQSTYEQAAAAHHAVR